jgi:hypothetical protein
MNMYKLHRGKAVPVQAMEAYGESRGIAAFILNLGARWRLVIDYKYRSVYPRGKKTRYPLNRKLGETQRSSV